MSWVRVSRRVVMTACIGKRIGCIARAIPFFVDVQAKNPLRAIRSFHRKAGKIGGEQNTLLQLVKFYDPEKAGMSGISGQSGNRLRRPGQQAAKIGI